jgi:UDP-N-acetylmuramate--alanine ligase
VGRLPPDGTAVLCADDPGALALAPAAPCPVVTYGFAATADVRGEVLAIDGRGARVAVIAGGQPIGEFQLVVPGRHNVANALGAVAAARAAGAPFEAAVTALASFTGAARRFHLRAEAGGVTVVDDYAHHPTEVAASLSAARLGGWKRVVAVFQPHLYSRTRLFATEFGRALAAADLMVVTDVYAAREDPEPGVDGALVAGAARAARPDLDCVYEPDRAALAARVASLVQPGDLVLTLGAGDITTLAGELAPLLGGAGAGPGAGGGRGAVDSLGNPPAGSATLPPRGAQLPAEGGDPSPAEGGNPSSAVGGGAFPVGGGDP